MRCLSRLSTLIALYTLSLHDALPIYRRRITAALSARDRRNSRRHGAEHAPAIRRARLRTDFARHGPAVSIRAEQIRGACGARAPGLRPWGAENARRRPQQAGK